MEPAQLADKIESLIKRKFPRLKLSDEDIAEMIFADSNYRSKVNEACKWLIAGKRLIREGEGVAYSPYWCRPWTPTFQRRESSNDNRT
jgi:hypothetical protein